MLEINYLPTDKLIPYVNNSRTHNEQQVKQIAASIREFGFTNPILIDEHGTIIAGHGRAMAADLLEIDNVPTITLTGLSDAQRAAYVIADNKLALNAGWDFDTIRAELNMLQDLDFDLDLLGFDSAELDEIVNGWSSDVDLPTTTNESSQSKIVVSCNELDKDDLLGVIERAVAESGIEQVTVSG